MTDFSDFSDPALANTRFPGYLPAYFGIEFTRIENGLVLAQLDIRPEFLAPNGFLHAATVVALADTCCGFGAMASLPDDARSFTTIELKSNFLATATEGTISCRAEARHLGRATQLWDAEVRSGEKDRVLAHFRCTQIVLR